MAEEEERGRVGGVWVERGLVFCGRGGEEGAFLADPPPPPRRRWWSGWRGGEQVYGFILPTGQQPGRQPKLIRVSQTKKWVCKIRQE